MAKRIPKHLTINEVLLKKVESRLAVGMFGEVPKGALSNLVEGLLAGWVDNRFQILPEDDEGVAALIEDL